jgi:hypothetical protein
MKKLFLFLFFILIHDNLTINENTDNKKTCLIPLSDAYPNRYFYHTPFQYNRFDTLQQWLCKGNFTIRYQNTYNKKELASFLFDNPIISTNYSNTNTYNAGILGLGFEKNTHSRVNIEASRNSFFIDCTVEISKVNSPYYAHIGIPVQRTEQKITMNEIIVTDGKVIKGGFAQEYQPTLPANLEDWQNTDSSMIFALPNMQSYLSGKGIGNRQDALFGRINDCPMTLWALADLYIQLGYDGWQYKNTNFGYYLRGIIPTSPTLKSTWNKFVFYPTIGNVDRFEFGFGINGNITLCDTDSINYTIYFDGYGGYLAKTDQMRPFDLKNGFFSRYGQVKLFNQENLQYINKTIWAVDLTSHTNEIGGCFKSELVIDFVYQYFQSFFNIGYSFKSQSKENISCLNQTPHAPKILDRYTYGYSPQQYIQTPNPLPSNNNWTTGLITPHSSMKNIASEDISIVRETGNPIIGIPITEENQLLKSNLDINSGLMNLQILNIFFLGYSYEKIETQYNTIIGIKGAISTTSKAFYSPPFYEILIFLELDY